MTYRIWERGVYKAKEINAGSIRQAVEKFAHVPVLALTCMTDVTTKSNPARWISSDGSAREFTAYEVYREL